MRPHVLHKHWNEARITVGVPGVHFHDLCHLAATLAAATGAGTKELMHRLHCSGGPDQGTYWSG